MENTLLPIVLKDIDARIIESPYYTEWNYSEELGGGADCLKDEGNLNFEELNDHEKFVLYVYAWNLCDRCVFKRTVMRYFGWTSYKVSKLFRELKECGMESVAVFSESSGLLAGRGYQFNKPKS